MFGATIRVTNPELDTSLIDRAHHAVEAARAVVDESALLVETSQALRYEGLATRCAWCERYSFRGRWIASDELPSFVTSSKGLNDHLTHGICPACFEELRVSGKNA